MKRRHRRQPHWICATTEECLCSGQPEECTCDRRMVTCNRVVGPPGAVRVDICAACKAQMICIDFATGELLATPEGS